jgi:MFS family permease
MVIIGTITMLSVGLVSPIFAPFVRTEFTASIQLVGLAVSGYFILRMFSEFPIGVLSDFITPKKLFIAGRFLAIIGAYICHKTRYIWALIFARIIWGVGDALFFCVGMSYVSSLFMFEKRGRALGFFQAVEWGGIFIGQTMGGFVAANYGPRINFLVSTILGFITLLFITMIHGVKLGGSVSKQKPRLIPSKEEMALVLGVNVVISSIIILVVSLNIHGLLQTILPIYATEELAIPLTGYAIIVSGSTFGGVVGNLLGGFFSDKLGRLKMLYVGLTIGLISTFGLTIVDNFYHLLLTLFLNGIFWGTVYSVIPAFIADAVPEHVLGKAIGTFRTFLDMGGIVGPILISSLVGFIGIPRGYTYAFYFGVGMMLICIGLVQTLRARDSHKRM